MQEDITTEQRYSTGLCRLGHQAQQMDLSVLLTVLCLFCVCPANGRQAVQLYVFTDSRTWDVAAGICLLKGGRLSTVDSATHAVLQRLYVDSSYRHTRSGKMWMGLRNWVSQSTSATMSGTCYRWSDCGEWDSRNHYNGFSTTDALRSSTGQCVAMEEDSTLMWGLRDCDTKLPYVCQLNTGDCSYVTTSGFCSVNYTSIVTNSTIDCQSHCDSDDSCWMYEVVENGGCRLCLGDSPFVFTLSASGNSVVVKFCFGAVNIGETTDWSVKGDNTVTVNCTDTCISASTISSSESSNDSSTTDLTTQTALSTSARRATVKPSIPYFHPRGQTVLEDPLDVSKQTTSTSQDQTTAEQTTGATDIETVHSTSTVKTLTFDDQTSTSQGQTTAAQATDTDFLQTESTTSAEQNLPSDSSEVLETSTLRVEVSTTSLESVEVSQISLGSDVLQDAEANTGTVEVGTNDVSTYTSGTFTASSSEMIEELTPQTTVSQVNSTSIYTENSSSGGNKNSSDSTAFRTGGISSGSDRGANVLGGQMAANKANVSEANLRTRMCPCTCQKTDPKSTTSYADATCDIIAELSMNRSSLSSARRKLTSAPDARVSSQTIGWFGVALVSSVFGMIVIPDLLALLQYSSGRAR